MKTEHSTIELQNDFKCNVAKLFNAFTTEETKRKWYADPDKAHDLVEFHSDMKVGGKEFCSIVLNEKTPVPGMPIEMHAECMAREDEKTLVLRSHMLSMGKLLSVTIETFQFSEIANGSRIDFTCQGTFFENSDGPTLRKAGWESIFNYFNGVL